MATEINLSNLIQEKDRLIEQQSEDIAEYDELVAYAGNSIDREVELQNQVVKREHTIKGVDVSIKQEKSHLKNVVGLFEKYRDEAFAERRASEEVESAPAPPSV